MKAISTVRIFLLATLSLSLAACAQHDPENFKRDDYFGGHGNMIRPTHHVPEEVQRVEPWFGLF